MGEWKYKWIEGKTEDEWIEWLVSEWKDGRKDRLIEERRWKVRQKDEWTE